MAAKTYRFTLRLDEEQEKFVKEVAERMDMTVPEVVRGAVDNLAMTLPVGWENKLNELPPETLKALNKFTEQIRRIGVNVNGATRTLFLWNGSLKRRIIASPVSWIRIRCLP